MDSLALKSCILPKNITILEMQLFADTKLESITIPDKLVTIEERVFYKCKELGSVFIPDNVVSIGERCFAGCLGLKSIVIPKFAMVHDTAFDECTLLEAKSRGYNLTVVEYYRDFYHQRIKERVTVLKSLLVYQEMREAGLVATLPVPATTPKIQYCFCKCTLRCSRCKATGYCSTFCKRIDYDKHNEYSRRNLGRNEIHLLGPLAFKKITAFEMWREILMYL